MTDIPRRPHISKSQMGTFQTCSLKYARQYIFKERGLPMPAKVGAGVGMHEAFARYFTAKKMGQQLPSALELTTVADASWTAWAEKQGGQEFEDPPNDEATLKADLAQAVGLFLEKVGPSIQPWAVELQIDVDLAYPDVIQPVKGYIDLVGDDDLHTVYDWKFAQRYTERIEAGNDHICYSLWHTQKFGVETTPFKTVQFVRYKKGMEIRGLEDAQAFVVTPADREFHLRHVIHPMLKQIEAGIWPANTANCGWCGFRTTCRPSV